MFRDINFCFYHLYTLKRSGLSSYFCYDAASQGSLEFTVYPQQVESVRNYREKIFNFLHKIEYIKIINSISGNPMKQNHQIHQLMTSQENAMLIAGIAHDYNNINCLLLGNISLIKEHIDRDDVIHEYLSAMEECVQQAENLSALLFTYSKRKKPMRKRVSLTKIILETTEFLLRQSRVEVVYNLPKEEIKIYGTESQIRQVLNNIIFNAKQAMTSTGTIRISAKQVCLADGNEHSLPCGRYAQLTFEDNGKGIPEGDINKIFDWHFTSKSDGQGLGLSICLSILKMHNGHIKVNSEEGKGAKFKIFLPINSD